ncbi:hypothetical protein [Nitratireductor soli]|uniref:hypothetical protein n=1 Tax=Nitratireductor soli TaxID=1670619 RepID=UPI00065DD7BF|nr:hypothetical protein [Nitratireductor soli]
MSGENHPLAWRLVRWLLLILSVPGASQSAHADAPRLGPFERPQPQELAVPRGDESFSPFQALNGSFSSPEHCAKVPHGLWVEHEGRGDCIRYYPHGLAEGGNRSVLVYFAGDVMLRNSRGVRFITGSYMQRSPASIAADMAEWSAQAGQQPTVYIARPGIYGSSGDHNMRRHPREIALMDRAVDMIKERYSVSSFILSGHSAGAQIVAGLLNRRADVSAAVMTSGLVSVKQVSNFWEKRRSLPGRLLYDSRNFYDPVDEIDRIATNPRPQIYMISDPEDRVVPFFSQLYYVRRLRGAGFEPQHIYAQATDPRRHLLALNGRLAAALLAQGRSPREIRRALTDFELDQKE